MKKISKKRVYIILKDKSKKVINSIRKKELLKKEFEKQKKENKSQRNEFDRHIEHLHLTDVQINKRAIHKISNPEEILLEKEGEQEIIRAIWNLPTPQNRRVYMRIVDEFSLTEIAKIENCSVPAIKQSLDIGIKKLRKILKNF